MRTKLLSAILIGAMLSSTPNAQSATIKPGASCKKSELGKTINSGGYVYACWYTKTTSSTVNNSQKWNRFPKGFALPANSKFYAGDIKGEDSNIWIDFVEKKGEQLRWEEAIISTLNQLFKAGWSCPQGFDVGVMVRERNLTPSQVELSLSRIEAETANKCPIVSVKESGNPKFNIVFTSSLVKAGREMNINGAYQDGSLAKIHPNFQIGLQFNTGRQSDIAVECSNFSAMLLTKLQVIDKGTGYQISLGAEQGALLRNILFGLEARACASEHVVEIGMVTMDPWVKVSTTAYPSYKLSPDIFASVPLLEWKEPFNISNDELLTWLQSKKLEIDKRELAWTVRVINKKAAQGSEMMWSQGVCMNRFSNVQEIPRWCNLQTKP
jgi:hypothetical protein